MGCGCWPNSILGKGSLQQGLGESFGPRAGKQGLQALVLSVFSEQRTSPMGRRGTYTKGVDIVIPGTKGKHGLEL